MAGGVLEFSVVSDREHGFEMAYPAGWVRSEWVAPEGDDSSPLEYVLAYADPKGAQVDGVYVDAEQISIYRLSRSVAPQEIDRSLANKIVSLMLEDFPALSIRNKRLQRMTLRGVAGWQLSYEYEVRGQTVLASSILFGKGARAYWVTLQASPYSWGKVNPMLGTCLNHFRLL